MIKNIEIYTNLIKYVLIVIHIWKTVNQFLVYIFLINVNMDQLLTLLERSFTSNDNQDLKELLDVFLSFCYDPNFYQSLFFILQNESIDPNIKAAGIIYFKNIIQYRWEYLPQPIHQDIIQLFLKIIIYLQDPYFIYHVMQISDLLIDKTLFEIDWETNILELIENNTKSSLILTRSLILQFQLKDITELLENILNFIFTSLQENQFDPLFLTLSLKIIRFAFKIIQFEDQQLNFLIQFMIENFSEDYLIKYIKIFSEIAKIKPFLLYEIEDSLISNIIECINGPKISIHFFTLLSNFSRDEKLWEMLEDNFIEFFIPFFSFDESEIENPVQFINDHYFDSFSSNSDPNSAAFRCLETISQFQDSVIMKILEFLKLEFESPSNKIYSISHISSAVLKNFDFTEAIITGQIYKLFNYVFQFIQIDSILIKCGILIILQFESYLETPIEEHVNECFKLIFDENELIQYFSMNVLLKTVPHLNDNSIFQSFPVNSVVSKILEVSQNFEFPQITDLLQYLFNDESYLIQIIPNLIEIVNSSFSFAQFYSEMSDDLISPIFYINSILKLKDSPSSNSIEFEICKLSFLRSIELLNASLLIPILEVIFTSLYYSPQLFDEVWNSFETLLAYVDEKSHYSNELIFKIFALICLRDQEGLGNCSEMVLDIATMILNKFEINEFSFFIACLIKIGIFKEEDFSPLICKIYFAWENDDINSFDDLSDLLAVLFDLCQPIFIEIFDEKFSNFLEDLINSIESKKFLMLLLPLIYQFLDEEQKLNCLSRIDEEDQEIQEEIEFGDENSLSLPSISLFSDSEIVENYQIFLNSL